MFSKKTIIEYDIISIGHHLKAFGQEIPVQSEKIIDNYGKFGEVAKIENYNVKSQKNNNFVNTLMELYDSYFQIVISRSIYRQILFGKVSTGPFTLFSGSSPIFTMNSFNIMMFPEMIIDREIFFFPLVSFNTSSLMLIFEYQWFNTFLELNYKNMLKNSSNQDLSFSISFEDNYGTIYEELYQLKRDKRFFIEENISIKNKNNAFELNLEKYGLIQNLGFKCSKKNTKIKIYRNTSKLISCSNEDFQVLYNSLFSVESFTDMSPKSTQNDIKDFYRIETKYVNIEGLFIIFEDDTLTIFKSDKTVIRYILRLSLNPSDYELKK